MSQRDTPGGGGSPPAAPHTLTSHPRADPRTPHTRVYEVVFASALLRPAARPPEDCERHGAAGVFTWLSWCLVGCGLSVEILFDRMVMCALFVP